MNIPSLNKLESILAEADDILIEEASANPKFHALRVTLAGVLQDVTLERIRSEHSQPKNNEVTMPH